MNKEFRNKIKQLEKLRAEMLMFALMNQDSINFKDDLEFFKNHVKKSRELYNGIHFDDDSSINPESSSADGMNPAT